MGDTVAGRRQRKTKQPQGLLTWPKDAMRVGFGVIWLVDAVLKWLPGFRSGYMSGLMGEAQGQPGWLKWWFDSGSTSSTRT